MAPLEPQSANDYDDRTTAAVKSVLVEIGQTLGSYRGKFVLIGGAVPWILLEEPDFPHIGTLDVDLSLDAEALGDGEYAGLVESLMKQGYEQRDNIRGFQLARTIDPKDDGPPIDVIVDFLMPKDADIAKNKPPLISNFAVQRADGAALAINFHEMVAITGDMPNGGTNTVSLAVATIPALLAMKGFAIDRRHKNKDAYDIFYSIRNYDGDMDALVAACQQVLANDKGREGYGYIADKFDAFEGYGPTCVRQFLEGSDALDGRSPDQWQQDAFGQVDAWLKAMGLRRRHP